ncbi:MAG: hypothetical protein RIM99_07080 [Cyclobacteriaceae bacterium]
MKKLSLILIAVLSVSLTWAQTTYVANNNPGAPAGTNVFTGTNALQDAINAAVSGDIIHVIPGPNSHGDVTIDGKTLTIIGVGLNTQGAKSLVDDIELNNTGASGSRISGLHFQRLLLANDNTMVHTVSNILLENSQLNVVIGPGYTTNSIANLIVRNCVLNSSNSTFDAQAFELYTNSGVIISNNIIKGRCCVAGAIQGEGLTIQNNLFFNGTNGTSFHDIDNSVVQNNIFLRSHPTLNSNMTGNTFQNNISYLTTSNAFTTGVDGNTATGNMEGIDPMLTNVPETTGDWDYSYDITPLAGSPVLNAGTDGTDIGPTGGATPFDVEGTFLPFIELLSIPAIVTTGSDLDVNIKAKGN